MTQISIQFTSDRCNLEDYYAALLGRFLFQTRGNEITFIIIIRRGAAKLHLSAR